MKKELYLISESRSVIGNGDLVVVGNSPKEILKFLDMDDPDWEEYNGTIVYKLVEVGRIDVPVQIGVFVPKLLH